MGEKRFLAFDLGAESGRAIIGTLAGGKLTLEEKHRFANPNSRIHGQWHWNLLGQWEELKAGLRKSLTGLKGEIAGIGIDTWGVDFGLLDRNGEVLGNPFMYRDPRNEGMPEAVFATIPREKVFEATGIQFLQFNSLFQLYAMVKANSGAIEVAESLLFMPDLFNYLFTGVKRNEFSITTTSQMYDPRRKDWARDLVSALGIPTRILGQIVPSGTVLGPVKQDVAEECGLKYSVPVIAPATHDTGSAVAAVPAEGEDWCYVSSGTWSLMGVELSEPVINEKSLKYNYTNEGGVGGTIRFLKNIMGMWAVQECRRQWMKEGAEFSYAQMAQMAAEARPFTALINPEYGPFMTPGQMPQKIEEFCRKTKQPVPSTKGEFVRTCLESLALSYRGTLEGIEDVLGRRIRVIHIVGGGCQNELLNQMAADACGRTVITGPVEATAMGNLLTCAMATGDVRSLADLRRIVRESFDVKRYEPRDTAAWEKAYQRYQEIL